MSGPVGRRSVALAVRTAVIADGVSEPGPPAASSTRAATPAALGVAADVPKKRQSPCVAAGQLPAPNPPAPLTETPSAEVYVGASFVRPPPPATLWLLPAGPVAGHGYDAEQTVVLTNETGP